MTNVTVTERAARRIGEILKYKFDVERTQGDDDIVVARNGATVLIDSVSLQYLAGSEIDFVDDLIGAAFKVNNPLAKASCGCGTSFTL
jgi:iron-sulfur cluster assembly accessory protein